MTQETPGYKTFDADSYDGDYQQLLRNLDFDLDSLRARYGHERDRRIRPDGENQYAEVTGKLAHYFDDDPYVQTPLHRESLTDEIDVAIIGGGWAGLVTAGRLKEAGITDIRIVDAGADFGGTWYWNRYPGAQCDLESYCYLPMLEETGYIPKWKYADAPEIFEHAQRIGRHFGLYENACFQTRVEALEWNDQQQRWIVATNRGDRMRARFVVNASGNFGRPKLPALPGLNDFTGHTFHTSRWDYHYTGGSHETPLDKLGDKRVGLIGTGATGVQVVPALAASAGHLYVFQRTPAAIDLRRQQPTDPEWAASLQPGWQAERMKNFDDLVSLRDADADLIQDSWTDVFGFFRAMMGKAQGDPQKIATLMEVANALKMNQIRGQVDSVVANKEVAEALKPWYAFLCKRPTCNDYYLDAFNRSNVTLVDTSVQRGVERATKSGVVANGVEYELDCLIFATGFEASGPWSRRIGYPITGRNGESLFDYWSKGVRTFHGHSAHGFPNWLFIGAGQNGISLNYGVVVDEQARNLAFIIKTAFDRGATVVEATAEGEQAWVDEIHSYPDFTSAFQQSCTPGFFNNEGQLATSKATFFGEAYAPGAEAFHQLLRQWQAEGTLEGLSFS